MYHYAAVGITAWCVNLHHSERMKCSRGISLGANPQLLVKYLLYIKN